jgi:hypothetical protein
VTPVTAEYVPAAHAVGADDDARQKKPAGHSVHRLLGAPPAAKEPPDENLPAGHGFVEPTACPATQKKPGGHGACFVLATVVLGQKKPAVHGFAVADALPVARHEPAAHGEHAAALAMTTVLAASVSAADAVTTHVATHGVVETPVTVMVFSGMPAPERVAPTMTAPDETAAIENVVEAVVATPVVACASVL